MYSTKPRTSLLTLLKSRLKDESSDSDTAHNLFDLMFLTTYLNCSIKWGHSSSDDDLSDLTNGILNLRFVEQSSRFYFDVRTFPEKIHQHKSMIKEDCLIFLDSPYQCLSY